MMWFLETPELYIKIRDRLEYTYNTKANFEIVEILLGQELRKRKTTQEKITIIQKTMEPSMNNSHIARLHDIQPSLLFKWRKQYQEGSLTVVATGEDVVPVS